MSFCTTCYELNPNKVPDSASGRPIDPIQLSKDRRSFRAKWSFAAWNYQAEAGCPWCALLCDGVEHFYSKEELALPQKYSLEAYVHLDETLEVWVSELMSSEPSADTFAVRTKLEFHVGYDDQSTWPAIKPAPVLRLSSEDSTDIIKTWIQNCLGNHPLCQSKQDSLYPGRLINVGGRKEGVNPRLHLADSSVGDYIALSHCWGTKPILRTVKSNIASHLERIPMSRLPKTFQDAITITRHLGVQFLWIDSLCIVQDDKEDWERESLKMSSVYGNAYLTIAATRAKDGQVGCFSQRCTSYHIPWRGFKPSAPEATAYVRRMLPHAIFYSESSRSPTQATDDDYPLFDRGWCYQERLLARRVIHYTRHEIVWECRSEVRCECNSIKRQAREASINVGSSVNSTEVGSGLKYQDSNRGFKQLFDEALAKSIDHNILWRYIVVFYTNRQLTFQRDKLPALSGVASRMSVLGLGDYIAGLWEHDLDAGLLWQTNLGRAHRPTSYTGPSFSWVSVVGPVSWVSYYTTYRRQFSVIEVATTKAGEDKFGKVSAGYVKIHGQLVAAECVTKFRSETDNYPMPASIRATLSNGGLQIPFSIDTFDDAKDVWDESVYCLLLFSTADGDEVNDIASTEGLVLRSTTETNVYSRIGRISPTRAEVAWWLNAKDTEIIII